MTKQVAKTVRPGVKTIQSSTAKSKKTAKKPMWEIPFFRKNAIIAAIGLGVIILGYILMSTGITNDPALPSGKWNNPLAVSVAPILLVLGYCVIIPYALIKYFGKKGEPETKEESKPIV